MKDETIKPKSLAIDNGLLGYLAPDSDKTHSRLDAYHSLLTHACRFTASTSRFGQEFNLIPGQFVVTITDLAKEWHWSRGAVRRFIDNLCQLGQLEMTAYVKCAVLDMVSLRFKWSDGRHPFRAINAYTEYANNLSLLDATPQTDIIRPQVPDLSGIEIFSPYVDASGNEIYSLAQRRQCALVVEELVIALTKASLAKFYSPRVEKSVLDIYHKVCGSDKEAFGSLVAGIFNSSDHPLAVEGHNLFEGWLERTETFFSLASSRIVAVERPPIAGLGVEAPMEASETASDEVPDDL